MKMQQAMTALTKIILSGKPRMTLVFFRTIMLAAEF
jgi:hypothetical protein